MIIILLLLIVIGLLVVLFLRKPQQQAGNGSMDTAQLQKLRKELIAEVQQNIQLLGQMLAENQQLAGEHQAQRMQSMAQNVAAQLQQLEQRLCTIELTSGQGMEQIRHTVQSSLNRMQQVQSDNLAEIQGMVEQKLSQTLEQKVQNAFQLVSERLEAVYRGLGEMQTLAAGVGDLKKVLSNVKTRGILGEVQLGAILKEIMAPEQYAYDVTVNPYQKVHVEYAVRLPGNDKDAPVWLPIDAKFPGDTYAALRESIDSGDRQRIDGAYRNLKQVIRKCAKDIHDKYICPPYTTNFAILFLPFEGLYAEVVNLGMVDRCSRNFRSILPGPLQGQQC